LLTRPETTASDNDAKITDITAMKYAAQSAFFFASFFGVSVERFFQRSANSTYFPYATEAEEPQRFFSEAAFL
jgi:hypothetical protein